MPARSFQYQYTPPRPGRKAGTCVPAKGACTPAKLRVGVVALITMSSAHGGALARRPNCGWGLLRSLQRLWRTENLLPHIVSLFLSFSNLCNLQNLWIALAFSSCSSWRAPIHVICGSSRSPKAKSQIKNPYIPTEIWLCFSLLPLSRPTLLPLSDFSPRGFRGVPPVDPELPRCDFHNPPPAWVEPKGGTMPI